MFGDGLVKPGPPSVQPPPGAPGPAPNYAMPPGPAGLPGPQVVEPTVHQHSAPAATPAMVDAPTPYLDPPKDPSRPLTDPATSYITGGTNAPGVQPPGALAPPPAATPAGSDDLTQLKQEALGNLGPLVDKLEQDPEDRFKTLMMMIQASDNPQYLNEAYAAANKIEDEKERAQALLDVVNEINYFTQHSGKN